MIAKHCGAVCRHTEKSYQRHAAGGPISNFKGVNTDKRAAKFSISLPEHLKQELDRHAADTGQNRSEAVAEILAEYFRDHARPPGHTNAELAAQLAQVRGYLETLHQLNPDLHPRPEWLPEVHVVSGIGGSLLQRMRKKKR